MNQPIAAPLTPLRPIPRATYRLQLHRDFGFREATAALPYLAALGHQPRLLLALPARDAGQHARL